MTHCPRGAMLHRRLLHLKAPSCVVTTVLTLGLFFAAKAGASDPRTGPSRPPKVLAWEVSGKRHQLKIWDWSEGVLRLDKPNLGGTAKTLVSAVGPIISTFFRSESFTGMRGGISETLQVEFLDGYRFDLGRYLDESRQAGKVMAEVVRLAIRNRRLSPEELAHCPPLDQLATWPDPFDAIKKKLIDAKCTTEERLRLEPNAFAFSNFLDDRDVVLFIQTWHPDGSTSTAQQEDVEVRLTPPAEWLPWLRAARDGNGLLGADIFNWLWRLPKAELARVRGSLKGATSAARRQIIESEVDRKAQAYLTACDLIIEFFPWSERPDLETQWAWSDLLLYYGKVERRGECLRAAAKVHSAKIDARVARAMLTNTARCSGDPEIVRRLNACKRQAKSLDCSRPVLEETLKYVK